jgi:hypothetical protein
MEQEWEDFDGWDGFDARAIGMVDAAQASAALSAVAPYAPAPFAQLARRCYRLRIDVPKGYAGGLYAGNLPYYRQGRRRSAFRRNHTALRHFCEWRSFVKRARDRRPAEFTLEVA